MKKSNQLLENSKSYVKLATLNKMQQISYALMPFNT